jgi:hypothetical protein
MAAQLLQHTRKTWGVKLGDTNCLILWVRCRVQQVEEIFQNGSRAFGIAVALDE